MRKIDVFTHIYPPSYYERLTRVAPDYPDIGKRMRNIPMLMDLDERFRVMDRFDDYSQVLSLPTPSFEVFTNASASIELARAANDGMAELVRTYPDRFAGFVAALPFADPDASVRELRRAVDDLGARGFQMFSFADPNVYYAASDTGHASVAYNFTTRQSTPIVDWDTLIPTAGLPSVYYADAVSADLTGTVFSVAIGGQQQTHPYIAVYNSSSGQSAVMRTTASAAVDVAAWW